MYFFYVRAKLAIFLKIDKLIAICCNIEDVLLFTHIEYLQHLNRLHTNTPISHYEELFVNNCHVTLPLEVTK